MLEAQPTVTLAVIAGVMVVIQALVSAGISASKEKRDAENRRKEKAEDYARQDVVAERVSAAARQVAEVARVAQTVNEGFAQQLTKIDEQGKKIHILVNSDMTAARTNERDQTRLTLSALKRVQALSLKLGIVPDPDEQDAIDLAEQRIEELDRILADRLAAQRLVDAEAKTE